MRRSGTRGKRNARGRCTSIHVCAGFLESPADQQYPGGPAIKEAGVEQLAAALKSQRVRRPEVFAKQLHQAAVAQTVTITGSATAARLISELAVQLAAVLRRRDELEKEIEEGFFALPEAAILRSLPGIGPRLGARIAVEIGSISRFRTPGHLAAYAGLGPTPWKSGTSINANMPSRFGNHRLKNALFLAAFASLRHAPSRTYYDRKRAQGKRHNQAVLCLARRRVDVLHAMLSQGVPIACRLLSPLPLDKQDRSTPRVEAYG